MSQAPTRPVMRYHGGKWRLAPWIISHFPKHRVYVEPFCGAASVLLQKEPVHLEVLNDLNSRMVSTFRVIREQPEELEHLLRFSPYSDEEYKLCRQKAEDPLEDARRVILLGHQSHGSTGTPGCSHKMSGWRRGQRPGRPSSAREWRNLWESVENWADRLRGVNIENDDAATVITRYDCIDSLFYVDPPYPLGTRTAHGGYSFEMSDDDHRHLAEVLQAVRGMVVLSGYGCDLYDLELYPKWYRVETQTYSDRAQRRTEVLWLNDAAETALHCELFQ